MIPWGSGGGYKEQVQRGRDRDLPYSTGFGEQKSACSPAVSVVPQGRDRHGREGAYATTEALHALFVLVPSHEHAAARGTTSNETEFLSASNFKRRDGSPCRLRHQGHLIGQFPRTGTRNRFASARNLSRNAT